ncbi:MAG: protein-L-isoaspartate O-methyltransferase, partial [Nitrospirota bacterium]|nr:protein-L-isoaspartate O-methyltransferase [Nitrospirota bacterium]
MVETIGAHALVAREELGKPSLDRRVLEVMAKVPRHEFVPLEMTSYAYADTPVPIGFEKTISQPFMVALMTDLLEPGAEDRVLEVGTGLGYQTAVLAELAKEVWT